MTGVQEFTFRAMTKDVHTGKIHFSYPTIYILNLRMFFEVRSQRMKDRNILFNDALNTFYLRLYSIGHMVKDHSDSERGNPLPPAY